MLSTANATSTGILLQRISINMCVYLKPVGQVVGVLVGGVGPAAVGFYKYRRKLPTVFQPGLLCDDKKIYK